MQATIVELDPPVHPLISRVREQVIRLLGEESIRPYTAFFPIALDSYSVYDIMTQILPDMSRWKSFHWEVHGKPIASMLETAGYSIEAQTRILVFTYARILDLLGPTTKIGPGSLMTTDGSPLEYSWIMPKKLPQHGQGGCTRPVRFAIEPLDAHTGLPLNGPAIMRYLSSRKGGLGLVQCDPSSLAWSSAVEEFLSGAECHSLKGSRFFLGLDFKADGKLTLKAYYIPPPNPRRRAPSAPIPSFSCPIRPGDTNITSLRRLVSGLDKRLEKPFEMINDYLGQKDSSTTIRFQFLAVDAVDPDVNRLKIYFQMTGRTSWTKAREVFTLLNRLDNPQVRDSLRDLERLWNLLFPRADSSRDTNVEMALPPSVAQAKQRDRTFHPVKGITFYYELTPLSNVVVPKIYLPVNHYCLDDESVSNAVEKFYEDKGSSTTPLTAKGWNNRDVSKAFGHRPLGRASGIHTYVAFGMTNSGESRITSYFSPETWRRSPPADERSMPLRARL